MYEANLKACKQALEENRVDDLIIRPLVDQYGGIEGTIEYYTHMLDHCDKMIAREIEDAEARQQLNEERQLQKEIRKRQKRQRQQQHQQHQQKQKQLQQQGVSGHG
jgi:hypothetical protein